jgi:oleate hydratase
MTECTGAEILEETLRHAGFADHVEKIAGSSTCLPCLLPYGGSVWLVRQKSDRPKAVPAGSTNFGFIGQFCEIPSDTVFTMEYSVRSAREAITTLLNLDERPPPVYQPHHDIAVLERVLKVLA